VAGVGEVNLITTAEDIASASLRAILALLEPGAAIEDSPLFLEFQAALEGFLQTALADVDAWWRAEGIDAFRFSVARKLGPNEAEFMGVCLLNSDQSWIPLHLELQVSAVSDTFERVQLDLGELGPGGGGLQRIPDGSSRVAKLLETVEPRLGSIEWAYRVTRTDQSAASG
jgi:hypothetical protein